MSPCCAGAIVAACSGLHGEIAELRQQLEAGEPEDVQVLKALVERMRGMLGEFIEWREQEGGFARPKRQALVRETKALLADVR